MQYRTHYEIFMQRFEWKKHSRRSRRSIKQCASSEPKYMYKKKINDLSLNNVKFILRVFLRVSDFINVNLRLLSLSVFINYYWCRCWHWKYSRRGSGNGIISDYGARRASRFPLSRENYRGSACRPSVGSADAGIRELVRNYRCLRFPSPSLGKRMPTTTSRRERRRFYKQTRGDWRQILRQPTGFTWQLFWRVIGARDISEISVKPFILFGQTGSSRSTIARWKVVFIRRSVRVRFHPGAREPYETPRRKSDFRPLNIADINRVFARVRSSDRIVTLVPERRRLNQFYAC